MGTRARRLVVAAVAVAAVAAAAIVVVRVGFERRLSGEAASLMAASVAGEGRLVAEADLADLPEPVRR